MSDRPVHEVLELVWPLLYDPVTRSGRKHICYAIEDLLDVTEGEINKAQDVVMDAVSELHPGSSYLLYAAVRSGKLPPYQAPDGMPGRVDTSTTCPEYIAFRNQWLRDLIEKQRSKA